MMNGKDFDCRDRARRKSLRLADARVGRVECAEMQQRDTRVVNWDIRIPLMLMQDGNFDATST